MLRRCAPRKDDFKNRTVQRKTLKNHVKIFLGDSVDIKLARQIYEKINQISCKIYLTHKFAEQLILETNYFEINKKLCDYYVGVLIARNMGNDSTLAIEEWSPIVIAMISQLKPGTKLVIGPNLRNNPEEVKTIFRLLPPQVILKLSNDSPLCCDRAVKFLPEHAKLDVTALDDHDRSQIIHYNVTQGVEIRNDRKELSWFSFRRVNSPETAVLVTTDLKIHHYDTEAIMAVSKLSSGKRLFIESKLEEDEIKVLLSLLPPTCILSLSTNSPESHDKALKFLKPGTILELAQDMPQKRLQTIARIVPCSVPIKVQDEKMQQMVDKIILDRSRNSSQVVSLSDISAVRKTETPQAELVSHQPMEGISKDPKLLSSFSKFSKNKSKKNESAGEESDKSRRKHFKSCTN